MSLPPDLAVGALYDSLLEAALRQFFDRAVLDSLSVPAVSDAAGFSIDSAPDPSTMSIRWFGTRYTLRVRGRWPFTPHEVRLARAIGAVLAARYRAVLNPRIVAERGDLFRGALEDRYVGAFLDTESYTIEAREARADRIASIIELLRVAALSSYESRPISTGLLLLGTRTDPSRPSVPVSLSAPTYTESLASIKSFFRLADGVRTVFLANADGQLLDIIDIERWAAELPEQPVQHVACANVYQAHARATLQHGNVCAVLSPSREIKVFAEGAEAFTFRGAAWHLLDLKSKYDVWAAAVGDEGLASCLFQAALNLSDAREGALFVVLREPGADAGRLVAPADRLDVPVPGTMPSGRPSRRDLLHLLEGRTLTDLDPSVLAALASLDGATVVDRTGRLLAAGAILRHPPLDEVFNGVGHGGAIEGARTTAAMAASRFGPVLKVSEDGMITFFDRDRVWEI
ncbi:MAG: hypothetical protein ABL993_06060 [Vicinamibacterales bacterium]